MKRFEVWLVQLDAAAAGKVGSEIKKTRPAIIVSPEELNQHLATVIVVPLTTGRSYAFRAPTRVLGKEGYAAVDQVRTVDKRRLVQRVATLNAATAERVLQCLAELFAP